MKCFARTLWEGFLPTLKYFYFLNLEMFCKNSRRRFFAQAQLLLLIYAQFHKIKKKVYSGTQIQSQHVWGETSHTHTISYQEKKHWVVHFHWMRSFIARRCQSCINGRLFFFGHSCQLPPKWPLSQLTHSLTWYSLFFSHRLFWF